MNLALPSTAPLRMLGESSASGSISVAAPTRLLGDRAMLPVRLRRPVAHPPCPRHRAWPARRSLKTNPRAIDASILVRQLACDVMVGAG